MTRAVLGGVEIGADRPVRLVGVLNVSPESFYAGSVVTEPEALLSLARTMASEGAEILDVGARSTAPYRPTALSLEEELERTRKALDLLVREVPVPISVDTRSAKVAREALRLGARILNDTSGLREDPEMPHVAADAEGVVLMALEKGPWSGDPVEECERLLEEALERALRAGIPGHRIVLDPGIGFFRQGPVSWDEVDRRLLRGLPRLSRLGRPLLVGVSRKSFLGRWTGRTRPEDRLWASLAATTAAVLSGAAAVRTHDVGPTRDAVRVAERLRAP